MRYLYVNSIIEFACTNQVLTPLLCNENNQKSWPDVVAEDVVRQVHTINNRVFVISGQIRGKTLLPLPDGAEKVERVGDADGVDHK
jgi:dynein heavy chain, axonemal